MRHTTLRFALDPTPEQARTLARYSGASRFAFNQSLQLVVDALAARKTDLSVTVPWSGFDLINAFNRWKTSESAGRVFVVAPEGTTTKLVTGLSWRTEVCAQVFEEAAVDLSRGLARYAQRGDRRVGFPRRKRKGRHDSFRLRNKKDPAGRDGIRIGQVHPRSVTLPKLGTVRVHDDTRRLRRMLRPVTHLDPRTGDAVMGPRARVLSATVRRRGDRWYVCLNLEAPGLPSWLAPPLPIPRRGSEVCRDRSWPCRFRGRRRLKWRRDLPLRRPSTAGSPMSPAPAALPQALAHPARFPEPGESRSCAGPRARSGCRHSAKLPS